MVTKTMITGEAAVPVAGQPKERPSLRALELLKPDDVDAVLVEQVDDTTDPMRTGREPGGFA